MQDPCPNTTDISGFLFLANMVAAFLCMWFAVETSKAGLYLRPYLDKKGWSGWIVWVENKMTHLLG